MQAVFCLVGFKLRLNPDKPPADVMDFEWSYI